MNLPTLEEVLSTTNLPTLPAVAIRVLELTRDVDVELKEIASTIENDQSMTVKIIRTVNSSFYHLTRPCTSIEHAMAYLGLNTVKSLVLGFSLVDTLKTDDVAFDFVDYWRRGIFSATGARILATYTEVCDADDAFLAGLLQDVGMVAMYRSAGDAYLQTQDLAGGDHEVIVDYEDREFGFTHATVGAEIAQHWTLPSSVVEAIREHHLISVPHENGAELRHTLQMARRVAEFVTTDVPDQTLAQFRADGRDWFGIQEDDASEIVRVVNDASVELSELFRVKIGDARDINQLITEAEHRMIEHQASMRRLQIQHGNAKTLDSLTGMPNLQQFTTDVCKRFDMARQAGSPVAVFMCDIDRMSAMNERYGYSAGDEVIKSIGNVLSEHIGRHAGVYRPEGDTFAVLTYGSDQESVKTLASHLRRHVAETPMAMLETPSNHVSISIGLAIFDPSLPTTFENSDALISAASKALKAAKREGDCVRAFIPSVQGKAA